MSDYTDKLKDPRWQQKRLKIFERDKWECDLCNSTEHELHLHHLTYISGREPWDYPDDNFTTLCKWCHGWITWACNRKYCDINAVKHFLFLADKRIFFVWEYNYKELWITCLDVPRNSFIDVGVFDEKEAEQVADFIYLPTSWKAMEDMYAAEDNAQQGNTVKKIES